MSCEEWLRDFMFEMGPMPSKYVSVSAKAAGFTRADLRAARKDLGVRTTQVRREGEDPAWYWELPREE